MVFTTLVCIFGWKVLFLSPLRPPRPPRPPRLAAPPSILLRLLLSALRLMMSSRLRLSDSSAIVWRDQVDCSSRMLVYALGRFSAMNEQMFVGERDWGPPRDEPAASGSTDLCWLSNPQKCPHRPFGFGGGDSFVKLAWKIDHNGTIYHSSQAFGDYIGVRHHTHSELQQLNSPDRDKLDPQAMMKRTPIVVFFHGSRQLTKPASAQPGVVRGFRLGTYRSQHHFLITGQTCCRSVLPSACSLLKQVPLQSSSCNHRLDFPPLFSSLLEYVHTLCVRPQRDSVSSTCALSAVVEST